MGYIELFLMKKQFIYFAKSAAEINYSFYWKPEFTVNVHVLDDVFTDGDTPPDFFEKGQSVNKKVYFCIVESKSKPFTW